jgi:small multidrug resistance family-3 protein
MNKASVWGTLLLAAVMEAGGDALVRIGLRGAGGTRWLAFAAGAIVLVLYGLTVNAPDWDFGKLIGVYIVFFFVVAQLIAWRVFHQPPSRSSLAGGALIVLGGIVLGMGS